MYNKLILAILLLSLGMPYAAFAESEADANETVDIVEDATETDAEKAEEADTAQNLQSGNGWRTVRIAELGKSGKFVQMVLIEEARHTDKTIYSNAIKRLCNSDDEFCRVRFWSNERYIPDRVAMSPDQRKQLKADYLINKAAGMHHLLWSCGVDPRSENCM